eukprot:SAG22_NODE_2785_length_2211_cov_14.169981_3_plen_161_part_01
MVGFCNLGQVYCFESREAQAAGGDRVYLQSRLRDHKLWSEMRLWNAVLGHVLGSADEKDLQGANASTEDIVARRNRRQVRHCLCLVFPLPFLSKTAPFLAVRRQTIGVFRQVLSQDICSEPELLKGAVVARHLDSFAYVMLAQLGMPLQPVLAFVESSCLE